MLVKDYVLWRLTRMHATDPSDGSDEGSGAPADPRWAALDALRFDSPGDDG